MANDIKIGMTLDDGGSISNKTKDAKDLKQTLMEAGEAAKNIRVPMATGAARQGMSARAAAAQPGGGASDTNLGRGIAGATGASARDFAAQAQGLGGLVHVYATFAANLYAVSAAFGALSKAADVTNITKGLDQLGAQSGRALGSLSKQMVAVTDGAISMQQAMTSTALASSGGMTNSAILRMTEVARKASLALGRDMPDSMDRLTKGIVKVQPELLDELGIMARVIPAQQAYAKAVGKSVGDLTEFEKRQAFANAVLEEGERKFGAIALQTNPYSKILASTENLMQTTLELVNTALSPLLNLLSSSPTALGLALAFIGKTLLSMALPAIGQWKKGLDTANEAARQNVIETNAQRVAHRKNIDTILAAKTANDELAAATKANLAIEALSNKASVKTKRLLPETANAVDKEGLDLLEKQNLALKKQGDLIEKKLTTLTSPGAIARNTDELNEIRATTKALDEKIAKGRAYEALEGERYSKLQYFTKAATDARRADAAAATSQRTAISKVTSEAYQKGGITEGWKALTSGIDNAKKGLDTAGVAFDNNQKAMSNWSAILTKAAGVGIIAVGVFETLASALSSIFIYIGVVVAAFELLDFAFGKNSKQAEAASAALDNLSSASQAANNVLKDLEARDPFYKISTAAMTAKANAILEVGDASTKAFKAIKEQFDSASWFDTLVDKGKILLGTNLLKKSSTELAKSVSETFRLASPGAETTKALKEIKDLTGIDPTDEKAFKRYLNDTPEKFLEIAPKITATLQQLGTDLSVTASKAKEFDDAFKTAGATFDAILVSMMPSDNLAKLGLETIDLAQKMSKALKDPTTALSKLAEISGDTSKLRFFSPDIAADLYKASPQIKLMVSDLSAYTNGLDKLKQEQKDLQQRGAALARDGTGKVIDKKAGQEIATQYVRNQEQQKLLVNVIDPLKAKIQPYIDTLNKEQTNVFIKGAKLVADSIGIGFEKARLTVAKATAQGLGDTAQGIQVRAGLDKTGIDIQIRQLDAQTALSTVMDSLRIVEEERLVFDQQKDLNDKQKERNDKGISATPSERAAESKLSGELVNRRVGIEIAKEMQTATLDAVMAALKLPAGSARQIAASIALPGAQQRAGAASQRAQLGAEKTSIDITTGYALMDHEVKVQKDLKATELERLTTQQQELDIRAKNALYLTDALLTQKQRVAEQIALNKEASDNLDIENEIAKAKRAGIKPGEGVMGAPGSSAVTELQAKLAQKQQRDREAAAKRAAVYVEEATSASAGRSLFFTQQEVDANTALVKSEETRTAIAKERFSVLNSMGVLDAQAVIDANAKFAIEEANRASSQALFDKRIAFEKEDAALKDKLALQTPGSQEALDLQAQIDLKKTYYDQSVAGENALLAAKTSSITQQQTYNTLLESQKTTMEKMVSITASLSAVFGDVGANVGKLGEVLLSIAQQDTQYLEKKKALEADLADSEPKSMKEKEATKALMKLNDEKTKKDADNNILALNSAKKLFGEKTGMYKLLDRAEKISSAIKLANQLKEMAFDLRAFATKIGLLNAEVAATATSEAAITATKVAAAPAQVAADVPGILSSFSKMGPVGFAIGAALVASLLAMVGGGGGASEIDMTGKTAEDRQKSQGTGTITGDSSAKSESITKSLDILNATSVEGLSYSNKMVELLSGIKDGISGVAKGVYGVVGLRSGSQFGTKEGESGFNFLGGLFGSSTSKQITDSGLKITGSFADVMAGVGNSIRTYEDVLTTSTSSFLWMSNTTQSLNQQLGDLDPKVQASLQAVFNNAGDLMIAAGKKLGMTTEQVMAKLATVDVSTLASLRGLQGQELDDALNSILSSMLDTASSTLFESLKSYNKFGEGMLETTMRVIDGMDKVNLAMQSVNKSIVGTGLSGIALSDAMITASGGLSNFIDNTKSFADNFLTPTERLIPKQTALNKELNSLGFASNLTRDQFKQLVLGFQVTDDASARTYAKLIGLSDAMNEVTAAESAAADQEIKIYELLGNSSKVLQLNRQKELDAMEDSLKPRQKYIYALTDEIAIRDKLKAAYTSTNNALTASIKLLTDYKNTLLLGNASTLSPAEKYAQSKSLLIQTAAAAKVAITETSTTAEIAARDAAVAKLPSLIDSFTATSRDVNASSAQYSADLTTVTDILDSTTGILTTQQTDMQKQLGWLEDTADNTKTMAELLSDYLKAQGTTASAQTAAADSGSVAATTATPHANGGIARGWSLVGERGPELVNFTNPGRVYTNQASNDLFNTKELIEEIKALREEVCQLRNDQNKQTGDIITSTFEANAQNAEAIATATANMANQQNWKTRSQVRVA